MLVSAPYHHHHAVTILISIEATDRRRLWPIFSIKIALRKKVIHRKSGSKNGFPICTQIGCRRLRGLSLDGFIYARLSGMEIMRIRSEKAKSFDYLYHQRRVSIQQRISCYPSSVYYALFLDPPSINPVRFSINQFSLIFTYFSVSTSTALIYRTR